MDVMDNDAIRGVRSFNRRVAQRIGALQDEYLARGRPLGASRLLWEIGDDGTDVRSLRSTLDLDSGYLSRLLRLLEREGLVEVEVGAAGDKRVRTVRVTAAGRAERAELDRRSDRLARSLLSPLNETNRAQLLEAMSVVERLLTAGLVTVSVENPTSTVARHCLDSYYAELDERFDGGFDPARSIPLEAAELASPSGVLVVARLGDTAIGCGGLRLHGDDPAEIKRMWVAKSARGLGTGRRILEELERVARERGAKAVRLETNRSLHEAIGLYRSAGYVEVEAFNDERYADHWFEKSL
jgi:DNA-binding MarR family transcriptional regulator/GNAT superfamily N-acetyltransferase